MAEASAAKDPPRLERLKKWRARRAEELTGLRYGGDDVVVVGDTPADIACGEGYGARTIAVATGTFSRDELSAHSPDFLFDSLEDADAVWRAVIG